MTGEDLFPGKLLRLCRPGKRAFEPFFNERVKHHGCIAALYSVLFPVNNIARVGEQAGAE